MNTHASVQYLRKRENGLGIRGVLDSFGMGEIEVRGRRAGKLFDCNLHTRKSFRRSREEKTAVWKNIFLSLPPGILDLAASAKLESERFLLPQKSADFSHFQCVSVLRRVAVIRKRRGRENEESRRRDLISKIALVPENSHLERLGGKSAVQATHRC